MLLMMLVYLLKRLKPSVLVEEFSASSKYLIHFFVYLQAATTIDSLSAACLAFTSRL